MLSKSQAELILQHVFAKLTSGFTPEFENYIGSQKQLIWTETEV